MKNIDSKTINEKVKNNWIIKTTLASTAFNYCAVDDLLELAYTIKGEDLPLSEYGVNFIQGATGLMTLMVGAGIIAYRLLNKK